MMRASVCNMYPVLSGILQKLRCLSSTLKQGHHRDLLRLLRFRSRLVPKILILLLIILQGKVILVNGPHV